MGKVAAGKNPEGKTNLDVILSQKRKEGFSASVNKAHDSKIVQKIKEVQVNKRSLGSHPWKPLDPNSFQEFFFQPLPILRENKDLVPPFLESLNEIDQEWGLDDIVRPRRK